MILTAIEKAGYKPGEQVNIALDCAATEFYDKTARPTRSDGKKLDSAAKWSISWPIGSKNIPSARIEDGCDENDWDGWKSSDR